VNKELRLRTTKELESPVVCKIPPGTKVSVLVEAESSDGTLRAKVQYYCKGGAPCLGAGMGVGLVIQRGWVSLLGHDKSDLLSPAPVSTTSTPTNSPPSMRPPSSMPPPTAFPPYMLKGSVADDDTEDGKPVASWPSYRPFSYRPGWSQRSEELRHQTHLANLNSPSSYRSEDVLPKEISLDGFQKLPVTASFKNRSDRRLLRLNRTISTAKAQVAAAEAHPPTRRMSHEGGLPDRKQRQHVLRMRLWRNMNESLDHVDNRSLDAHYHMRNAQWDPMEA